MAATHVVSLFLPHTLFFHDKVEDERPSSPEPTLQRSKPSVINLPTRASAPNLFEANRPTTPLTPSNEIADFFSHAVSERRHFGKLVRTDIEAPEWGSAPIANQPRSRAGPLPSGSILDFAKVVEQLQRQKARDDSEKMKSPPRSRSSRAGSHDREGFERKNWTVEEALQGNGGLTNAMRSAAAASSETHVSWIGTLGFPTDELPPRFREQIDDHLLNEYESEVVYVSDKDLNGHYTHFCKTILWPIFHYQVPDHPKSKAYADHSWEFYRNVNQAFADKVVASYRKNDEIWIHDYHLLLVPGMVRQKLPEAKMGFFLHSAFPSSEVFRCLARRKELLEGMLGANLVAFQTDEYTEHFLQTCSRLLNVETTIEGVQLEDRFVNVTSQPIGINPPAIQEARQADEVQEWINNIKEKYADKLLIVARDKLDNIHGVRQKLLSFELFLNKYPQWVGKVILIQVATSTAEHTELLTTVSDICNRIDTVHSTLVHQPLIFLKQDIDFSQYLALLTCADVLMISALRDGMNLQAHDYIFCQDGQGSEKKYGPLILSEFTGSAAVFRDHISINPWDYQKQANAINRALKMSERERESRWRKLHAAVIRNTGGHWAEELSKTLTKVHGEQHQRASTSVPRLSTVQVSERYKTANRRLFILDYEGTLAPHQTREGIPLASPTRIIDTLNDLMTDPKNIIYIMSGRQPHELENVFRTATSNVGLIAENGCFVRDYDARPRDWATPVDLDAVRRWKHDVKTILKFYHERMPGSWIEERRCALLFHYARVEDPDAAARLAADCADQINAACKLYKIQAVPVGKAVLVQMTEFNKATAAADVFARLAEVPGFLMVVGDDREDEVVFRWANDLAAAGVVGEVFTVSVGKRNTQASAALTQGSTGLLAVLQRLARVE